jgi:hypothetical protein
LLGSVSTCQKGPNRPKRAQSNSRCEPFGDRLADVAKIAHKGLALVAVDGHDPLERRRGRIGGSGGTSSWSSVGRVGVVLGVLTVVQLDQDGLDEDELGLELRGKLKTGQNGPNWPKMALAGQRHSQHSNPGLCSSSESTSGCLPLCTPLGGRHCFQ